MSASPLEPARPGLLALAGQPGGGDARGCGARALPALCMGAHGLLGVRGRLQPAVREQHAGEPVLDEHRARVRALRGAPAAAPDHVSAVHPVHVALAAHRLGAAVAHAADPAAVCPGIRRARLTGAGGGRDAHQHLARRRRPRDAGWPGWKDFFSGPEIPTWVASATNFLVTYCFGLALGTGLAFYQRLRDAQLRASALERALTQAHLAALRMQLSPHTLFNLLHTIRGQITWDPPAAQTMVVQLGDLLRRLLTAGEREFSRLSDELQFVTPVPGTAAEALRGAARGGRAAARRPAAGVGAEPDPAAAGGECRGAWHGRPRGPGADRGRGAGRGRDPDAAGLQHHGRRQDGRAHRHRPCQRARAAAGAVR